MHCSLQYHKLHLSNLIRLLQSWASISCSLPSVDYTAPNIPIPSNHLTLAHTIIFSLSIRCQATLSQDTDKPKTGIDFHDV